MPKKKKAGGGKKGAKKGKGKKKAKGEKKEEGEKKSKKKEPTEKELFERQVEDMKTRLEDAMRWLSERMAEHSSLKAFLGKEKESKESCLSHLQRKLKNEFQHYQTIQDRLQTERDLVELVERRALGRFAATERSGEATRSLFLQKKAELEGKLSLLEEIRLERVSQGAHLRRAEAALEERASALCAKGREEDSSQVDSLLSSKKAFLSLCEAVQEEFRTAFELRLPVHAGCRLQENVRLRGECGHVVDALLTEQERSRLLRTARRAADLEEEVQVSADACATRRMNRLEERREQLFQAQRDLLTSQSGGEEEMVVRKGLFEVASRMESILSQDDKRCTLFDKQTQLNTVLQDQERHKMSLKRQMEDATDRNGSMISGILRAGKIITSRTSRTETESDMDHKVLQQMKMLLDLGLAIDCESHWAK